MGTLRHLPGQEKLRVGTAGLDGVQSQDFVWGIGQEIAPPPPRSEFKL